MKPIDELVDTIDLVVEIVQAEDYMQDLADHSGEF